MAQKTIQANFKRMLTQNMKKIGYMAGLGDNVVLDLTLGGVQFIDGIRSGMKPILKEYKLGPGANSRPVWREVAKRTAAIIKKDERLDNISLSPWDKNVSTPGIYLFKSENLRVTIRLLRQKKGKRFVTGDNRVHQIATAYRNLAYQQWIEVIEEKLAEGASSRLWEDPLGPTKSFSESIAYVSKKRGPTEKTIQSIIAQNTNVAHKKGTTKADLAVKMLKESNPSLTGDGAKLNISVFDILDYAEKSLEVTFYKNDTKKKVGNYTFNTLVETRLAYNVKGSEESDMEATINKFKEATAKFIEKELGDPNSKWHDLLVGMGAEASKKPRTKVAEDVIEDIIRPMTKAKTAKRSTRPNTTFKPGSRQIKAKTGQKAKAITRLVQGISLAGKVGRPAKQKRQVTTNLQKLQRDINKRLPAEIRRNMGRPALINQTGRFSNSAEITNLKETPAGLSANYTYQLSPYETFENKGVRKWPTGYNPKPLIAKSIRQLAMQYTEQRLVSLRRT